MNTAELEASRAVHIVLTCKHCGFTATASEFVKDKRKAAGAVNVCLDCANKRNTKWKRAHRDQVLAGHRDYKTRNRDKRNAYARKRRSEDAQTRIAHNVRSRISFFLKGAKSQSALALLGVSHVSEYIAYLESRFELGMSWSNYGNGPDKWNIDHIKPVFKFDLTNPKQRAKAFHYSNTRPMWQSENGSNGAIARWRKEKCY